MELGRELWMLEQGLAELAAEGLPPVEQSAPLDMPDILNKNAEISPCNA